MGTHSGEGELAEEGRDGFSSGGVGGTTTAFCLLRTWKRPTRTLSVEASCTRTPSLAASSTVEFAPCRKFSSGARDSVTLPTITDMTAKVPAG